MVNVAGISGSIHTEDGIYADFCGYFPAEKPKYTVFVSYKRPETPASGGGMAGQTFRKIAEQNDFLHEGDTLTEAFIKALPDTAQQEKCNALNRRTEFKVLRTTYGLFDLPVKEPKQEEGDAAKDKDKQEAANNKEASAEDKKQAGQPVE